MVGITPLFEGKNICSYRQLIPGYYGPVERIFVNIATGLNIRNRKGDAQETQEALFREHTYYTNTNGREIPIRPCWII